MLIYYILINKYKIIYIKVYTIIYKLDYNMNTLQLMIVQYIIHFTWWSIIFPYISIFPNTNITKKKKKKIKKKKKKKKKQ